MLPVPISSQDLIQIETWLSWPSTLTLGEAWVSVGLMRESTDPRSPKERTNEQQQIMTRG